MIDPSVADKITPEMMQKIQELQVYLIDDVNNTILGRAHILYAHFFVGHWSLVDAGEISGFHSERNWLSTTDYVHVSFLLRLHTRRQRLPRSYFLRIRQCQFKYFRWRTRRLIHVCYHLQLEFFNFFALTRFFCCFSCIISVLYNIMSNSFIPIEYKQRLRSAARIGRDFQQCNRYDCPALSEGSSRF